MRIRGIIQPVCPLGTGAYDAAIYMANMEGKSLGYDMAWHYITESKTIIMIGKQSCRILKQGCEVRVC